MGVVAREDVRIIRPAAILDARAAAQVLQQLRRLDVAAGGVWNASSSLWQRYDAPWDGVGGTRGDASLLGSIAVMYDSPHRHEITVYKVTVTVVGPPAGLDGREPLRRRPGLGQPDAGHLSPRRADRPPGRRPVQAPRHRPRLARYSSRWARSGSKAGRQTATYSAPSAPTR